ncbi:MAG: hypothetical protein UU48_C0002G0140 [Candidatus Uhrbacteria bacterium GW2011_GWF2_41_16]|uniref:Uncharacterized protein n=2 Tax=Candidatus Uhriibacteriota TaxID=1752732 RepID=A0A0G0XP97_9BACT|nr:MAG: hypothetical protein UU31_C0003G0149 [Candidatus Uhrbacteria bacterium GW2011_GWA2_41_10]KKR87625.1 MAG: hypothetical protein UU35_C0002G0126 [Candidatus Uhrbacteria bacterium GW2011_GWC2_41_11]KKR98605.1 MAG: hypothetical protein UU48_C0002G0140 [Candidatus Uhrbacteria bacterium GW2011_GWF2_41_16]HBO99776.1 hypothetical protein [Candidatus Uhrbacteria bacterium]
MYFFEQIKKILKQDSVLFHLITGLFFLTRSEVWLVERAARVLEGNTDTLIGITIILVVILEIIAAFFLGHFFRSVFLPKEHYRMITFFSVLCLLHFVVLFFLGTVALTAFFGSADGSDWKMGLLMFFMFCREGLLIAFLYAPGQSQQQIHPSYKHEWIGTIGIQITSAFLFTWGFVVYSPTNIPYTNIVECIALTIVVFSFISFFLLEQIRFLYQKMGPCFHRKGIICFLDFSFIRSCFCYDSSLFLK